MPLVSAIGNVAFPRLAARYRLDDAARRMQWLGIAGSACAAAALLVPPALVAPWLVPWIFGHGYAGAVPLLRILVPSSVFMACNQVTGDVLRGRKRPLAVARAEGLAAVFTVVLLAALLPVGQVYGAAIASTVAYGVAPRHDAAVLAAAGLGMPAVRRVAAIATDLTCQAVGRRAVVRAARYVLSRARLDYPNDMHANGETSPAALGTPVFRTGTTAARGGRRRQRGHMVALHAGHRRSGWAGG